MYLSIYFFSVFNLIFFSDSNFNQIPGFQDPRPFGGPSDAFGPRGGAEGGDARAEGGGGGGVRHVRRFARRAQGRAGAGA